MTTPSAPEYPPNPSSSHSATRRVSAFGRNGRDGQLDRDADDAQWQDAQPTQAVDITTGLGDGAATTALPESYAPADYADVGYSPSAADPTPTMALPTGIGHTTPPTQSTYAPASGNAQPGAPARLPARPARRHTAATPLGTILVLVASALLGWGMYTLLTSIDVFAVAQGTGSLINTTAAAAFAIGGVLAFIAFIVAIVAVVRARPKTAAALLLVASLVLPTAATVGAAHYGASALEERTVAQAVAYAGSIDVDAIDSEQIDAIIDRVESLGVDIPGKDEVLDILRSVKGE
ncbi:hypothetical protein [Actinomyces glycerinitolerans]|uniref:Uncharacterized protein n=1 Tax=Actinomyces glycerinitolerans TaxID=1892869 RepID=A0A1M4RWN3_9ACTO|nr:hypothetical protein [Actinomyces glycerinitolerans]SHE24310.1 Hypothetical protein ACGLYG10_0510 [Actinomyces glycerinitolerans]